MWSLEFVEVADDELMMIKKASDRSDDADTMSRDSALSQPVDIASSVLSNRHTNLGVGEYSSSLDSDTGHMQYAIDNWLSAEKQRSGDTSHADNTDSRQHSTDLPLAEAPAAGEMFAMDDDEEPSQSQSSTSAVSEARSATKSETLSSVPTISVDTPESGDFCFVTEQDINESQMVATGFQQRKLRDGFHWQKQLVFRSKLTMHTAFERKDNKDPAAVTALAVSRCCMMLKITVISPT